MGPTFLVVWHYTDSGKTNNGFEKERLSDLAVFSFTKICIAVNTSPALLEYRHHPAFRQRRPNYSVRLGFGLHCGWAIEGAVGSEFKVNPTYLSPNVNFSKMLCRASVHYGVSILLSEEMVENLSEVMADECRVIDRVVLPGSTLPNRLFAFDFDQDRLVARCDRRDNIDQSFMGRVPATKLVEHIFHTSIRIASKDGIDAAMDYLQHPSNLAKVHAKCKLMREEQRQGLWHLYTDINALLQNDSSWKTMRDGFNDRFFQNFDSGYRNYEAGEWELAKKFFEKAEEALMGVTSDGVCRRLYQFMEASDFQAPKNWPGYRSLF